MKIKPHPTVTSGSTIQNPDSANNNANAAAVGMGFQDENAETDPPSLPTENVPKVHQEAEDFDGDRVLANSILFLQDFGWWIEISYAVPEGDIGRAFEILKVNTISKV